MAQVLENVRTTTSRGSESSKSSADHGANCRVGLVDNEDPWDEGEHGTDAVARLEAACRVVRRAEEGDRRAGRSVHAGRGCDRSFNFGRIHDERVVALAGDKGRAGEQGDVGVKRVRRLEHRRGPAGAAVGEQDALDHLVRAVGAEHLCRLNAVVGGQRLAERGRFPVGIAVQVDASQLGGQRLDQSIRRRLGGLVGVQPHLDLDLRRVVSGPQRDLAAPIGVHRTALSGEAHEIGCGSQRSITELA